MTRVKRQIPQTTAFIVPQQRDDTRVAIAFGAISLVALTALAGILSTTDKLDELNTRTEFQISNLTGRTEEAIQRIEGLATCSATETYERGCCRINALEPCTETGDDDRCLLATICDNGQCLFRAGERCTRVAINSPECEGSIDCGTSETVNLACIRDYGEECESSAECKAGSTCAMNANGVLACIKRDGESCATDDECAMMRDCAENMLGDMACVVDIGDRTVGPEACPEKADYTSKVKNIFKKGDGDTILLKDYITCKIGA